MKLVCYDWCCVARTLVRPQSTGSRYALGNYIDIYGRIFDDQRLRISTKCGEIVVNDEELLERLCLPDPAFAPDLGSRARGRDLGTLMLKGKAYESPTMYSGLALLLLSMLCTIERRLQRICTLST